MENPIACKKPLRFLIDKTKESMLLTLIFTKLFCNTSVWDIYIFILCLRCYFDFLLWSSEAKLILFQGALKLQVYCSSTEYV